MKNTLAIHFLLLCLTTNMMAFSPSILCLNPHRIIASSTSDLLPCEEDSCHKDGEHSQKPQPENPDCGECTDIPLISSVPVFNQEKPQNEFQLSFELFVANSLFLSNLSTFSGEQRTKIPRSIPPPLTPQKLKTILLI